MREYSEGLDDAVACNDYPQPYAMDSPVRDRPGQYDRSVAGLRHDSPRLFAPFTVDEWVGWSFADDDDCLRWPRPSRWVHAVPPNAVYPDLPTLVLNGDLDSLTSPEGGRMTADAFPESRFVEVANTVHVTALFIFVRARRCSCAGSYVRVARSATRRVPRTTTRTGSSTGSSATPRRPGGPVPGGVRPGWQPPQALT